MQELQVNIEQAKVEIVGQEVFEKGIADVVAKYQNYTVTAGTIKDDKRVLAELRKLTKQISDERIKIKNELSKPATDFEKYIKETEKPLKNIINQIANDVKEFENHQKALRLDTVKSYLANKASEDMIDPRIFDGKATEYLKNGDFMADGVTLKKATMKALDDMVTFEYQKQEEFKKATQSISGLCSEYGMTDQPYIRMLQNLTLAEVLDQIRSDHAFELQKQEAERKRQEQEALRQAELQKQKEKIVETTPTALVVDSETGEIIENTPTIEEANIPESKRYRQKMTLEVYFEDSDDKDRFKRLLSENGWEYKQNYTVSGYQNIASMTEEELKTHLS
jgi:phage protein